MFKFLKNKLKESISKLTKRVDEVAEDVVEVVKEDEVVEKKPKPKPKKEKKVEETKEKLDPNKVYITYFVHGTTTDNQTKKSTGWAQGELSELGIKQSEELWDQIDNKNFEVIISSDLKRAVDSAEITFGGKNIKIIHDKRIRECNYGDLNEANSSKVVYKDHITNPFPKGESLKDVEKRIAELLNELYDKYKGKRVALVSHESPQLAIEVLLDGKTWEQAIDTDWRKTKSWQPGWLYEIKSKVEFKEPKKEKWRLFKKREKKVEPVEQVVEEPVKERKGIFKAVGDKIKKKNLSEKQFNEIFWELEIVLLENNVAVEVIEKIKSDLRENLVDKPIERRKIESIIQSTLKNTINELFDVEKINLLEKIKTKKPYVICFVGINGSGKTTTIAKVVHMLKKNNLKSVLAASDTFRAAAIQQLEEHATKLGVKIIKHDYGADAAAVAFDAIKYAEAHDIDVVLVDTAGRLHSNTNLMDEMKKIKRVSNPDMVLFIGESITGNDCIEQAKSFDELIGIDGIILSKADIDEKGGAAISISYVTKKPILYLGTGQGYDDLTEFDSNLIVESLGL